jgi:hypothetical protein
VAPVIDAPKNLLNSFRTACSNTLREFCLI